MKDIGEQMYEIGSYYDVYLTINLSKLYYDKHYGQFKWIKYQNRVNLQHLTIQIRSTVMINMS